MARARRLLWLSAFAGIVYVLWRWRGQQAEAPSLPAYTPPPSPTPAPAAPPADPAALGAPPAAPKRIITTRVHRGAPPSPGAPKPEPEPEPEPEPPAVEALAFREAAVGADPPDRQAEPPSEEPAPQDEPAAGEAQDDADEAQGEPAADLAPLIADAAQDEPAAGEVQDDADAAQGETGGQTVNINTASANALIAIPGIGRTLAKRIIAYRKEHGPFSSVDDLVNVQGIGPRNLDEFRHLVTV